MKPARKPVKTRLLRKNLVTMDGTLDAVDHLYITVQERGKNAEPFEMRIGQRDMVREHVDCNNPLCENGGFSLGNLLREMVKDGRTDYIGTGFCTGEEQVHPEVPDHVRSCRTRFEIQATLHFR